MNPAIEAVFYEYLRVSIIHCPRRNCHAAIAARSGPLFAPT